MDQEPISDLLHDLGKSLSEVDDVDRVFIGGNARPPPLLESSGFCEIPRVENPKRMAFVDGGTGLLDSAPNFAISINRAYYGIFCGRNRIKPKFPNRVEFLSYTRHVIQGKRRAYETRIFPYGDNKQGYLPKEEDLSVSQDDSAAMDDDKLNSMSMKFAEWHTATRAIQSELKSGDMLVMDGSLQPRFKKETEYAERLYDAATDKGVILCGLSKTSTLVTESGAPLLARISEIAGESRLADDRWYINVAERISKNNEGHVFAARLHPKSEFVYRFEILRRQLDDIGEAGTREVLGSLAANSDDIAMLGYPYGAVDADRFAQVRHHEVAMYQRMLLTEQQRHPVWKRLKRYSDSMQAHQVLNRVSG